MVNIGEHSSGFSGPGHLFHTQRLGQPKVAVAKAPAKGSKALGERWGRPPLLS